MKQVIVMRKDLNMRKGKMIAQGAHASLGAVLPYLRRGRVDDFGYEDTIDHRVEEWLAGPFKKICVYVNSEAELDEVYQKAEDESLLCCMITDSGLTEFGGVPTKTCCAIGPDTDEELEPITGELKLL